MTLARTIPGVVAFLVLATACVDGRPDTGGPSAGQPATDESAAGEQAATIMRGMASFQDGRHTLVPCGTEEALWIGAGGELLGEAEAGFDLFVALEAEPVAPPTQGPGAAYDRAIVVRYVLYAFGHEGPGCDFEWDTFVYRARGNEPFWMLEVGEIPGVARARTLRLVRPGESDQRLAGFVEETSPDGSEIRIGIPGETGDASGGHPELIIRRERCRDTMSGAYFGLSGRFRYLGQTFTGCVLLGTPPASGEPTGS